MTERLGQRDCDRETGTERRDRGWDRETGTERRDRETGTERWDKETGTERLGHSDWDRETVT